MSPATGNCTVTEFGTVCPAEKFKDDVDGTPVASPGRTATNPVPVGSTAVTLATTAVAPTGTTTDDPPPIGTDPVMDTTSGCVDTNGPCSPRPSRVSTTCWGATATKLDDEPSLADAATSPPAPSVTRHRGTNRRPPRAQEPRTGTSC